MLNEANAMTIVQGDGRLASAHRGISGYVSTALNRLLRLFLRRGCGAGQVSCRVEDTLFRSISDGPATKSILNCSTCLGSRSQERSIQREVTVITYPFTIKSFGIPEGVGRASTSLRLVLKALAAWRLRRRQRAELYALSDRTLKDIGVSRWEIKWIVSSPDRDASGRLH